MQTIFNSKQTYFNNPISINNMYNIAYCLTGKQRVNKESIVSIVTKGI